MKTILSVIIPVYNVAPYLKRCLDSVVNQTLKDIEIILVDDCSTDGSLEILKEYVSKDERIKLIILEQNHGAAVSRNKGLEAAKGEYIGFVDSDDKIDLNFYEELYKKAKETNADIVKGEVVRYIPDGTTKKGNINKSIKENNKFGFIYEFWSAVYKASLIFENNITFPDEIRKAQDIVFLNRLILKTQSVVTVDSVYYHYYRREDSLDADKISIDKIEAGLMAYEYISDNLNSALGKDIFNKDYLNLYFFNLTMILNYLITKNDSPEAKRLCIETFIKLFNKCKIKKELSNIMKPVFAEILSLAENNNIEELVNIFTKYKDTKQYFFSKLKNKVTKDLSKNKQEVV